MIISRWNFFFSAKSISLRTLLGKTGNTGNNNTSQIHVDQTEAAKEHHLPSRDVAAQDGFQAQQIQKTKPDISNRGDLSNLKFQPLMNPDDRPKRPDTLEISTGHTLSTGLKSECRDTTSAIKATCDIHVWNNTRETSLIKCSRLLKSKTQWHNHLGETALFLFYLLEESLVGNKHDSTLSKEQNELMAAILYLVETDDIIPDHVLGKGYSDDAYVINECIKQLKKDEHWRNLVNQ